MAEGVAGFLCMEVECLHVALGIHLLLHYLVGSALGGVYAGQVHACYVLHGLPALLHYCIDVLSGERIGVDGRGLSASLVVENQCQGGGTLEVLEIALAAFSHGLASDYPDVGAPAHPDALHGPRQAHLLDVRQHLLYVPSEHFTIFPVVRLVARKPDYRDDVSREFDRLGNHPVPADGVHHDERPLLRGDISSGRVNHLLAGFGVNLRNVFSFLAEVPHDLHLVDLVAPGRDVSERERGLTGGVVERDDVLAIFPACLVHGDVADECTFLCVLAGCLDAVRVERHHGLVADEFQVGDCIVLVVQHCPHHHVACSALDATGECSLVSVLGLAVAFNLGDLVLQLLVGTSLVDDVDVEAGLGERGCDCVALGVDIVVRDGRDEFLAILVDHCPTLAVVVDVPEATRCNLKGGLLVVDCACPPVGGSLEEVLDFPEQGILVECFSAVYTVVFVKFHHRPHFCKINKGVHHSW